MKKYGLILVLVFLSNQLYSQTEYVELSNNDSFNRSFACYYNDDLTIDFEDDFESSVVKGDLTYHWVEYTHVRKVHVICSDSKGSYRKICLNGDCKIYDTNNHVYIFNLTGRLDSLKFYKPNYDIKSDDINSLVTLK